jgi:hypothetical protein
MGQAYREFWWGNLREMVHWGDPSADRRIILRWMFKNREGRVRYYIDLVRDRNKWRAIVNAVMNLRVP